MKQTISGLIRSVAITEPFVIREKKIVQTEFIYV